MARRSATLVVISLISLVVSDGGAVASSGPPEFCDRLNLLLCSEEPGSVNGIPANDNVSFGFRPNAAPEGEGVAASEGAETAVAADAPWSEYLGNNTCRYHGTGYADGAESGDGIYGVDDNQGAYVTSSSRDPGFIPGTDRDWALAKAGVSVFLSDYWPQPSNVTVTFPWHANGKLDVDAGVNIFGGTGSGWAGYRLTLIVERAAVPEATRTVMNEALITNFGPKQSYPSRWGTDSLNVITPANFSYRGYILSRADTSATSTYLASAFALTDFFQAGHAWTDYQDWHFNLPSGYVMTTCG